MFENAKVKTSDRIVINGAGGGIGSLLIQLASQRGLNTIAIGGSKCKNFCLENGVERFIDYRETDPAKILASEYDNGKILALLDCVGTQHLYLDSHRFLHEKGVYVNVGAMEGYGLTMLNGLRNTLFKPPNRKYIFQNTIPTKDRLRRFLDELPKDGMRIRIDAVFPFSDAPQVITCVIHTLLLFRHMI